jgi:hypothetical protein
MAVYPNSVFPWTARRNNLDVVWAADPNSLASEIQAIESIIGTNPNVEPNPPTGSALTYSTMSARVTDAMDNNNLPYSWLRNSKGFFINAGQQIFNSYNTQQDPYNIWNSVDGTIPCSGWWTISATQKWNQLGNNFRGGNVQFLLVNGNVVESDIWNWDTFFAIPHEDYASSVLASNGQTHVFWQGLLHKGDRIQSQSINNTFCPGIQVNDCHLRLMCNRVVSGTFTSG